MLVFGAGLGARFFCTRNLWLPEAPGIARSVEGALAGGMVAIELHNAKWHFIAHQGLTLVPTKIPIAGTEVRYEKRCSQYGVPSKLVSTVRRRISADISA